MVGRGGNSRNWLSPLFMLIHYSMAKYDNIPGCPGYYISKRGQIYSRVIPNGDDAGKLGKVWREMKVKIMVKTPTYSTKRVKIRNKSYSVSRLVALAWVPNPDNKPCVCHKDNNPLNNHYKNLYWGTHQENMAQIIVDGRKQKGEKCPRWVNKEIPELFDYYRDGVSTMELADLFVLNKLMINKIIRYKFKELWQGRK